MKQTQSKQKQNFFQALKFLVFSLAAGVIETLLFTLLNELCDFPYWPSYLTALVLSVLFNFTVNRKFTFKSAANVPIAMGKLLVYYLIFTPLSTIGGNYLVETCGWNEYLVLGITMVTNLVTEFLVSRFWLYGKSINTAEAKPVEKNVK